MRAPVGPRKRTSRALWCASQALLILSLIIGLITPLIPVAAAQQGALPPPLPAPFSVALAGSFQTALGCPADFDPSCPQTQLQDNGDGSWSAVLPVPPGDYAFRVIATSDTSRSLGEGGNPNGADLFLSVPGNAAGAYFSYDSLTGDITAEPVANLATLTTDLGEQFAMAPSRRGGYQLTWDAEPGNYGFQVLINGEPVTQDSVSLDGPSRVIVAVDNSGAVTTKDTLRDTRIDVSVLDAAGAPRAGACFALIDRESRLRAQGCDGDDGQPDGSLRLRVPNGLDDGNYTLRETFTPEGGVPADDQRIQLGPGRFEVAATSAGGAPAGEETPEPPQEQPAGEPSAPVVEPGEQPGRLTVVPVDAAGQPVPGACFAIVEFGFELCDDDFDGAIIFDAVPSAPLTLRETVPPQGFSGIGDLPISIEPTGARLLLPHEPAAGETPVEPAETPIVEPAETPIVEPVETPQTVTGAGGQVLLSLRDRDGNPVLAACWALSERGGGQAQERCDGDDGAEDGVITFDPVPAGRYRLEEVASPPGFQPASGQAVEVADGAPAEVTIAYRRAEGRPGRLVIFVNDENGNPVAQTCFDLRGPIELTEICDRQDDGQLNIPDLPAGEYTVTQTQVAEGRELAEETAVVVPEDDTVELQLVSPPTGTEQGQQVVPAGEGRVLVDVRDEAGSPVAGACAVLSGGSAVTSVCDNVEQDENGEIGQIEIAAVPPGDYQLSVDAPEGFTAPEPTPLQVRPGETASAAIVLAGAAADAGPGEVTMLAEDADGNRLPGACYTVEIPPGGQAFGPFCDEDGDGAVTIQGVTPGLIAIVEATPPTDAPAADPARQELDIAAGERAELVFTRGAQEQPQAETGAVDVRITGASGEALSACVDLAGDAFSTSVCDNRQGDASDRPGRVRIDDVPPGSYTVALSELPGSVIAPEPQQVDVQAGQTVDVTFTNATGPGTLVVFVENEEGERVGGSCFTLRSDETRLTDVCDRGDDGRLNIPDLPPGAYTLIQTQAGGNRELAPEQHVTVAAGQTVELTVQNPREPQPETPTPEPEATATPEPEATATPEPEATAEPSPEPTAEQPAEAETGTVEFATFDDAGNPVTGQCYTLAGGAGTFGPFCDNGEGDVSGDPGLLVVAGLPAGTYEAVLESEAVAEPDAELAQQAKQRRSVSVRRGNRPTRVQFNVRAQQTQRGDLLIRVRDQDGDYLAGACFGLIADGETEPSIEVCDNRSADENTSDGRILITGIKAGRYTLTQTEAPRGHAAAADQSIRIQAGSVREVSVTNRAERDRTAAVDVETIDADGNLLPDACYALIKGGATVEACDADTGEDGITQFTDLDPVSYVVRQTQVPSGGFAPAADTATTTEAGQTTTATVVNDRQAGSLLLRKTDDGGQLRGGSCFSLIRDDRAVYTICDNDASDGNRDEGIILLGTVAPATYVLRETQPPTGYVVAADQEVTVSAGQRAQVNVANGLAQRPVVAGDVRVFKIDSNGSALAGACFALIDGNGQFISPTCDAGDGEDNGVILIAGVSPGQYTLRETRRPSAAYQTAADLPIEVLENQTVDVEVENLLRLGRIFIRKFDPNGVPLAGACFDVVEDSAGAACTDENGELLFVDLAAGTYSLVETEAPPGYFIAPALDPVTVRPGSTATVDVVDEPAPPPPDSGSIQVVKFVCPAGEGGPGIVFVDSSDPDGGGLARTAGCDRGDAAFLLEGPSGPIELRTGDAGRYQTTLDTGDYLLTELSTGAAEDLAVFVNTLTTVVVVNYVVPDGQQPVTIDVIKYTCAPGFQGQLWADFAEACLSAETLTNNVSFRLSGPVSARRVTGDAGIGGATRFENLPAGDYKLREEVPLGTVAVYAFCGLDPAAPDGRAVGNALTLRVSAGQAVTCHWFNVPEDLAGNTGAITVYKLACPITVPPNAFDWYGRCDPQGQGVPFSLSVWDGAQFQPVTTAATDGDGILRFTRLQPGLYDLKEIDAIWCHAESDSVDAQGRVVVEAGVRASVWIFNCVGAKAPPNTGAGPMWSGAGLAGPLSSLGVGLSLLWPLIGVAVLRRRRWR